MEYKSLPSGLHNVEEDLVYVLPRSVSARAIDHGKVTSPTATTMPASAPLSTSLQKARTVMHSCWPWALSSQAMDGLERVGNMPKASKDWLSGCALFPGSDGVLMVATGGFRET